MSWQDAPLYVRSLDLCRDLLPRTSGWAASQSHLAASVSNNALGLLDSISLALAFPEHRALHQQVADEHLLCLRVQLRLAEDLAVLGEGAAVALHSELTQIGRMLGGWRKRERRRLRRINSEGAGPPLPGG